MAATKRSALRADDLPALFAPRKTLQLLSAIECALNPLYWVSLSDRKRGVATDPRPPSSSDSAGREGTVHL